jgi:Acetyltransferase (GNAT) domain
MQIVDLAPELYPSWNAACLDMDDAWFWHTSQWLEYTLEYRPELRPQSYSFMVTSESRVMAICPLIVETRTTPEGGVREFSFGGGPGPAPALANGLTEKARKVVLGTVGGELDARARRMEVARISFRASPPAPAFWCGGPPRPHPLLRSGFVDIPLATQIIDLSESEVVLLRNMRKGHRDDVKRYQQLLQADVYDAANITPAIFDQYRQLHHRAAGRVTRPQITFEMMRDWIESGMAILALARRDGATVGCALISVYKDGAYYSSACNDPGCDNLPVGHVLQWAVMRWLKTHGIARYEIGIQPHGIQPHSLFTEKELNISMFKRGFGGTTVTFWVGEKFYSREYYQAVMRDRVEKFASAVFASPAAAAV